MKNLIRIISVCIVFCVLLSVFPAADDGVVYLGDRGDLLIGRESLDGLGLNRAHSGEKLTVWELSFKKGLGFHCLPDKDAYLEFDISSLDMKYFAATVGVLQKAEYYIELGSIAFSVYGDGKLLAETPVIAWGKRPYYICVDVEGVSTLRLVENNVDGYSCDAGVWGDAALYASKPDDPEWWKEEENLFDPDKTDLPQPEQAVSGDFAYVSDLYWIDARTYTGNVVGRDCNTANEIIFSTDGKFFEKGLGFHASSGNYTSYIDVNIEGLGFTKFAAYYGHDITMASVKFALFGDGKKLFESETAKFGEAMKPMEADITGVKVLRIAVAGVPTISGAWGTWGGAVISKSGDINDGMLYKETDIESLFRDDETEEETDTQTESLTDSGSVTDAETVPEENVKKSAVPLTVISAVCAALLLCAAVLVIIKMKKRG